MLHYAVICLVIALIAALSGLGGMAAGALGLGTLLFFLFIAVASGDVPLRVMSRWAPRSAQGVRMFESHPAYAQIAPAGLHAHYSQCQLARGRLHRLHCAGEWLNAYLAPRFASSLVLMVLIMLLLD